LALLRKKDSNVGEMFNVEHETNTIVNTPKHYYKGAGFKPFIMKLHIIG
jgi:hypothetical protein